LEEQNLKTPFTLLHDQTLLLIQKSIHELQDDQTMDTPIPCQKPTLEEFSALKELLTIMDNSRLEIPESQEETLVKIK
jgi:hypothetical protein